MTTADTMYSDRNWQTFGGSCCFHLLYLRFRQQVPLKCWSSVSRLHGVRSQELSS